MAVSLILIYVIQKLVGFAHQASPLNLKPLNDDVDMRHLGFEDQLQFIDTEDQRAQRLLEDIRLDSLSVSYVSVSVLLFEFNEKQGCLSAANYSVIRTFSAVNVGPVALHIRGFRIGPASSVSNAPLAQLQDVVRSDHISKHQNHMQQRQFEHQIHQTDSQKSICQGYGFTIHDCDPFELAPHHERKIRIAFTPDFTLTKTVVSLTIITNTNEEFKFALIASIPRNLLALCNQSLPRPDWEPFMHLIVAIFIILLVLASIMTAYMDALLYLKSQKGTSHGGHCGGSAKDNERHSNNCSNYLNDVCNKDRNSGGGHGAPTTAISSASSHHQQQQQQQSLNNQSSMNALSTNGNGKNYHNQVNMNKNNNGAKPANCNTQKRRKNSSTANSNNNNTYEKVPTSMNANGKSNASSNTSDKKQSSPYTPIFQNLTNVISSPPPPIPAFDAEFDAIEFKKLRGKRSNKKSNSLNGSIASNDDIGNSNSLNSISAQANAAPTTNRCNKYNQKINGIKSSICVQSESETSILAEHNLNGQTVTGRRSRSGSQNRRASLKDVVLPSQDDAQSFQDANSSPKLYKTGSKSCSGGSSASSSSSRTSNSNHDAHQSAIMPIKPPSSSSSPSSTSSTSSAHSSSKSSTKSSASKSSSSNSSISSSPPPTATSYGEYSLLGPGATFELPCLRVRSAQI